MGAGVSVLGAYLPLYTQEQVNLSAATAGLLVGVMGFVGIVSRIAWGWSTERIGRFSLALAAMSIGSVVGIFFLLGGRLAPALVWLAVVVFGATAVTWNAVGMLAVITSVEAPDAGRASGHVLAGFYSGFIVTPALFGYSVDSTGTYLWGWLAVAGLFATAAMVARGARLRSAP